jgi:hypothetical protein
MQLTNLRTIKNYFPQNPIQRIEYNHQMRQQATGWRGQVRAFLDGILVVMAAFAILLCLTDTFGLDRTSRPAQVVNTAMLIFVVFVVVQHFVTMLRTLALSSNSIVRERERQSWDLLVLTGIDGREVVRGKWAATVQRQWKYYLFLGMLRAGAAIWWGYNNSANRNWIYNTQTDYTIITPTVWHILLAVVIILLLTQMNLLYTAAVGVRASVPSERATGAIIRAILHRFIGPLALVLVTGIVGALISGWLFTWGSSAFGGRVIVSDSLQEAAFSVISVFGSALSGFLDNGAGLAQGLAATQVQFNSTSDLIFLNTSTNHVALSLVVTVLLLLLYWALTNIALRNAERLLSYKGNLSKT